MADKLKDAEDELLESLFAAEAIADDGFSARIEGRIRRRLWVQRLSLPIAAIIGGIIAFKPAAGLVTVLADVALHILPAETGSALYDWLPPAPQLVAGVLLLAVAMVSLRMLED
jgi:hypothetical protein